MAKRRTRRRNHPLPAFRDYVVRFLDDGWGKSGAESAAAMKRHAGLVEGSWKAGEPAEHVAEVIAKSEHWRKATKVKRRRSNPRKTYAEHGAAHRAAGRVRSYVILGSAIANILKAMRVGQSTTIDGIKITRVTSQDEYEADGVKIHRAKLVARLLGESHANPRRPAKKWMSRCTKAVRRKGGAKKAGAVCAATWKRKAASERRKAVAEERRRARRANAGAAARHRRALQEASVKGAASALRRLGYRVKIERGRPR